MRVFLIVLLSILYSVSPVQAVVRDPINCNSWSGRGGTCEGTKKSKGSESRGSESESRGSESEPRGGEECDSDGEMCSWLRVPGRESVRVPVVTESDFEAFRIPPSVLHSWPGDWGIVARRTVFYADSGVRNFDLELLGQPVEVRAVPVEYVFSFGDGVSKVTSRPGNKPADFANADVYHVYEDPGVYEVGLVTVYRGMYRVGDVWLSIPGVAEVASEGVEVEIFRFHKYVVSSRCVGDPGDEGCPTPAPQR